MFRPARKKWFFLSLLFCASASAADASESLRQDAARIALQAPWLKLMHYSKGVLFGYKSRVDGPGYFFAVDGKTNPEAELLASVEAFTSVDRKVGRLSLHPQCAFPYRYRYLKKNLRLTVADVPCPELDRWLSGVRPKSATVVYASGYANNPVSVFGHLFLRVNSEEKTSELEVNELLDQGIGYEAVVEGSFGFQFAMGATFGGYSGQFSVVPYYAKVQEYSNLESRDLWEYHLGLSKEEVGDLLIHLWELETNTYLNYFFVDENCAYQLLALIQAIKPEWDLTDKFSFYVMPSQSVRVLAEQPGAVRHVTQRLSLQKRMTRQLERLDAGQREQFDRLVEGQTEVSTVQDKRVLEVAGLFLSYKKQSQQGRITGAGDVRVNEVLRHRATLGGESTLPPVLPDPEWSRPDRAHYPFRAGVLAGVADAESIVDVHYKVSLHDLLNFEAGYAPHSRFDFLNAKVRVQTGNKKVFLKELDLLRMETYLPIRSFERDLSWRVGVSLATPEDLACYPCRELVIDGAVGAAFQPWSKSVLLYAMTPLRIGLADHLEKGYRWGPGLETGIFFEAAEVYRAQLSAGVQADLSREESSRGLAVFHLNQSYFLNQHWDVRWLAKSVSVTGGEGRRSTETGLQLNYYF